MVSLTWIERRRLANRRDTFQRFSRWLWQKLSFDDDDDDDLIDDVTSAQPDVISDRLLAYKLRQATMLGHLTDYRRRIEELDVMVCILLY